MEKTELIKAELRLARLQRELKSEFKIIQEMEEVLSKHYGDMNLQDFLVQHNLLKEFLEDQIKLVESLK